MITPLYQSLGPLGRAHRKQQTLLDGLAHAWRLDEVSGTRVALVGGQDLTDVNTVGVQPAGPSGTVAKFVASSVEYLSASALIGADADFSLDFWFKVDDVAASYTLFDSGGNGNIYLRCNTGFVQLIVRGFADTVTSAPVRANVWVHVTATHDSVANQIAITVNGVTTTAATGGPNGAATATLWGNRSGDIQPLNGQIARARLWLGRVLTPSEGLYNLGSAKTYAELSAAEKTNLTSSWEMDEASGNRADSHGANTLADNGTVGSVASTLSAKKNGAARFVKANSERLTHSSNASLQTGEIQFCVAGWVFLTSSGAGSDRCVISKGSEFYVDFGGTGVMEAQTMHLDAVLGDTIGYDAWHWFYFQYDPAISQIAIQLDGGTLYTATASNSITPDSGDLEIGSFFGGSGAMDGMIDELYWWKNRLLNADERTSLQNGLYYPFAA